MPNLNVGSIYLGEHDYDWFVVMSKLGDKASIRGNLSSITEVYVRNHKHEYIESLYYLAAKYGLSPQETFQRLLNGKPLDEILEIPLKEFPIPGLGNNVADSVAIDVPLSLYEQLAVSAKRQGLSVSELIARRFSS